MKRPHSQDRNQTTAIICDVSKIQNLTVGFFNHKKLQTGCVKQMSPRLFSQVDVLIGLELTLEQHKPVGSLVLVGLFCSYFVLFMSPIQDQQNLLLMTQFMYTTLCKTDV